jgi:hypothetical protein
MTDSAAGFPETDEEVARRFPDARGQAARPDLTTSCQPQTGQRRVVSHPALVQRVTVTAIS